jgi:hypothetical protein
VPTTGKMREREREREREKELSILKTYDGNSSSRDIYFRYT